jgi:hypothetical protein
MKETNTGRYIIGSLSGVAISFLLAYCGSNVFGTWSGTAWDIPSATWRHGLTALIASDLEQQAMLLRILNLLIEHASSLVALPIILMVGLLGMLPSIASTSGDRIAVCSFRNYLYLSAATFFVIGVIEAYHYAGYQAIPDYVMSSAMRAINWIAVLTFSGMLPAIAVILSVIEVIARHGAYGTDSAPEPSE